MRKHAGFPPRALEDPVKRGGPRLSKSSRSHPTPQGWLSLAASCLMDFPVSSPNCDLLISSDHIFPHCLTLVTKAKEMSGMHSIVSLAELRAYSNSNIIICISQIELVFSFPGAFVQTVPSARNPLPVPSEDPNPAYL